MTVTKTPSLFAQFPPISASQSSPVRAAWTSGSGEGARGALGYGGAGGSRTRSLRRRGGSDEYRHELRGRSGWGRSGRGRR